MSLDHAIRRVTTVPAQTLKMEEQLGTLRPGAAGDGVVFALEEGSFPLVDSHRQERIAHQRLAPFAVVKSGRRYDPAAATQAGR
jgi:dihydroorotase